MLIAISTMPMYNSDFRISSLNDIIKDIATKHEHKFHQHTNVEIHVLNTEYDNQRFIC